VSTAEPTVVHAYGLVPAGATPAVTEGIDSSDLATLDLGGLAAVVSELSADRYGPAAWRDHAEDPRWLEVVVRQHHAVLQSLVEQVDVLPLRLPGIHESVAVLETQFRSQWDELAEAFDRVRGHVELGAKVYLAGRDRHDEPSGEEPPPSTGRDYLQRRLDSARAREHVHAGRQAVLLDAHESLTRAATHARVNPLQDPALSGRGEPMMLNAAYLVARARTEEFWEQARTSAEALGLEGMSLEVTGPWPPYNFTDWTWPSDGGSPA
jgi:Gas vesicle synthesis protein GvpL/GvpF